MKLDVIFTADEIREEKIDGKNIVVIDVLRATTVMITALAKGVKRIHVFEDTEDVIESSQGIEEAILCGERKGLKVEGFHYGNSPLEYGSDVEGKIMYMTTSNGTKALVRSDRGNKIFIGAFINLQAVVEKILEEDSDTVIVCAGTDGEFTMDDSLCAGTMIKKICERKEVSLTDAALAVRGLTSSEKGIHRILEESKHYTYLKKIGFQKDLEYCLTSDTFDTVPCYRDGVVERAGEEKF